MTLHCGKSNIAQRSKTIFFHPEVNYVFRKGSYFIKRIYTSAYKLSFYFSKIEYFQGVPGRVSDPPTNPKKPGWVFLKKPT